MPAPGSASPRAIALVTAGLGTCALLAVLAGVVFPQAPRDGYASGLQASGAAGGAGSPSLPSDTALRVTFLDVGQGDAVLLQAPEGQTALVDAGRYDVVPLLREMGVERIDLLVATHPHADHIGGMAHVIESMPVRSYMDNGDPHATATYRRLLAALDARPEITYLEALPRTISLGSVEIEVLPLLRRGTTDHNNRSVTLVVRYGTFTAFLSGDSEIRQLTDLVGRGVVPRMTLLKAPHHGSDNGFTPAFLRAGRPEVVVISVGRNGYGHPRPAALSAYAEIGARVLRTDMDGHVGIQGYRDGGYGVVRGQQVALPGTESTDDRDRIRVREAVARRAVGGGGVPAAAAAGARVRVSVHADAPGDDHRNLNGEYAVLQNQGDRGLAIGGWTLCDGANHCFRFPARAVLATGGTVVVYTGSGRPDSERYYMGMGRAVWNNSGDTATLRDGTGATVAVFRY